MNQLNRLHAIWNPHVYHGWGKTKRYFEGWYYKIVSKDQNNAFAIIPGIAMDENGNKQLETNNKDGELDGVSTLWFDNGQKKVEVIFKKGKILSEKKWNEDGSTNQK